MAIYGDLGELPFPELLSLLGKRNGQLTISANGERPRVDLHLQSGYLTGMRVEGRILSDPLLVRDSVRNLVGQPAGEFEFIPLPEKEPGRNSMRLSLQQLMLSSATVIDELAAYRDRLPAPGARLRSTGPLEVWVDDDLARFWDRAEARLRQGTSAEELAGALQLHIEQVQLYLYKLRTAGALTPVRSYSDLPAGTRAAGTPRGLLRGLLRTLGRLGGNSR